MFAQLGWLSYVGPFITFRFVQKSSLYRAGPFITAKVTAKVGEITQVEISTANIGSLLVITVEWLDYVKKNKWAQNTNH